MRKNFERRTTRSQELMQKVMERADRFLWRCDPQSFVEGANYLQITRLLQGYIENEVDLNKDGQCWDTCTAYQLAESHGCYKELYCARQPKCAGKLLYCQFFDADMWVCPSSSLSDRRYEFIEYENGKTLGEKQSCNRGTTKVCSMKLLIFKYYIVYINLKVDSWWRYLFWHCSYCFCVCDEQGKKSDRYFSLMPALSNLTSNM